MGPNLNITKKKNLKANKIIFFNVFEGVVHELVDGDFVHLCTIIAMF